MERRSVLAAVGTLATVGFGGCLGLGDGNGGAAAGSGPGDTPTPDRSDYTMPAGSSIVEARAHRDFEGEVRFTADCRETEVVIPSGGRVEVGRTETGESCEVTLVVDGETVVDRTVAGYASARLTVTADGDVEQSEVVV